MFHKATGSRQLPHRIAATLICACGLFGAARAVEPDASYPKQLETELGSAVVHSRKSLNGAARSISLAP